MSLTKNIPQFRSGFGMMNYQKELLSEELLEQLDGKLIEAKTEDGAVYPVAIELTDSSFAKRFELKPQPSYLVFLVNGRHIDRAENLISYLMTDI